MKDVKPGDQVVCILDGQNWATMEAAKNYITAGENALKQGVQSAADQCGIESMNCSSKARGIYAALTIMDQLFGIGE